MFKQAILSAKSVGYSEGASGVYISAKLFKTLGIEDEMAFTAKQVAGELVGEAVARDEINLGKAFVDFLMSDEAAPAFKRSGLDAFIRAK
jgi:hypothetical protein